MEHLYRNVIVEAIKRMPDQVDFKVRINDQEVIELQNCQLTHDYNSLMLPLRTYIGQYKIRNNDEIKYKWGCLHCYETSTDLLLGE